MLSRRSHGVFVSEMPYEMEEEEERDEEDSGDDLDDVEEILNEDDESDMVLEEDEVRQVLSSKRQEISKKKLRRGFGRPSKSAANTATRKFRAEVEELQLRTNCNRCGNVGHWARECPQKRVQNYKGGGRGGYSARKNEYFSQEKLRETHFCAWSPQRESRFLCFFESKHCSLLERIRKRRQQRCSLLENAKKQRMERERAIGEYEAMLNSSPGNGIIDTGCAKMMMGSDPFKQYLDQLTSKERASVEKVREKNRFRFGDNEKRMSHWSAVIPMNTGKHVCREKVAIILGDAPFLISTHGSSSGPGEREGDIQ